MSTVTEIGTPKARKIDMRSAREGIMWSLMGRGKGSGIYPEGQHGEGEEVIPLDCCIHSSKGCFWK